jgi:hypothetical protein
MEMARRGGRTARRAASGISTVAFTLGGVALLGVGVPLFWIWTASQLAGEDKQVTSFLAIFIATGILVSYWVLLLLAGAARGRWVSEEDQRAKVSRASWNRSFRDEPLEYGKEKLDPVERVFILTTVVGFIAFEIWFAFFAGSPLGSGPNP